MNDLYLIGNGFDLAHGLKTSYNDFLLWYLNDSLRQYNKKTNFDDGLIKINHNGYFQDLNEDFISISNLFKWCKESGYFIKPQLPFFEKLISNVRNSKWVDIEYEYYLSLIDFYKRLERANLTRNDGIDGELRRLNNCFELIKKKLEEYLLSVKISSELKNTYIEEILFEPNGIHEVEEEIERMVGQLREEKLFVYFNYTSTLDLYTKQPYLPKHELICIHGKLIDEGNPIIFGYGDEMDPHYEKIENLNTKEFLDNMKSFGYFRTDNYQRVIRFIDSGEFTVKILGHSCGLSDRILLNSIFEHPNCKWIKIYYYQRSKTENDYFEKTQEISRHFKASGKGDMRTKIVPFNQSASLVPFISNN